MSTDAIRKIKVKDTSGQFKPVSTINVMKDGESKKVMRVHAYDSNLNMKVLYEALAKATISIYFTKLDTEEQELDYSFIKEYQQPVGSIASQVDDITSKLTEDGYSLRYFRVTKDGVYDEANYTLNEVEELIIPEGVSNIKIYACYSIDLVTVNWYISQITGVYTLYRANNAVRRNTVLSTIAPDMTGVTVEDYEYVYDFPGWSLAQQSVTEVDMTMKVSTSINLYSRAAGAIEGHPSIKKDYRLDIYFYDPSVKTYSVVVQRSINFNGESIVSVANDAIPSEPIEYEGYMYAYSSTYRLGSISGPTVTEYQKLTYAIITNTNYTTKLSSTVYLTKCYNEYIATPILLNITFVDELSSDILGTEENILKGTALKDIKSVSDYFARVQIEDYRSSAESFGYSFSYEVRIVDDVNIKYLRSVEDLEYTIKYDSVVEIVCIGSSPLPFTIHFKNAYTEIDNENIIAYEEETYQMEVLYDSYYSFPIIVAKDNILPTGGYDVISKYEQSNDGAYTLNNVYLDSWQKRTTDIDTEEVTFTPYTTNSTLCRGSVTYIRKVISTSLTTRISFTSETPLFTNLPAQIIETCSNHKNFAEIIVDTLYAIRLSVDENYIQTSLKDIQIVMEYYIGSYFTSDAIDYEECYNAFAHGDTSYDIGEGPGFINRTFVNIRSCRFIILNGKQTQLTNTITYYDYEFNKTVKTYNRGTVKNTITNQPTTNVQGEIFRFPDRFKYWTSNITIHRIDSSLDFFDGTKLLKNETVYAVYDNDLYTEYNIPYPPNDGGIYIMSTTSLEYVKIADANGTISNSDFVINIPSQTNSSSLPYTLCGIATLNTALRVKPYNIAMESGGYEGDEGYHVYIDGKELQMFWFPWASNSILKNLAFQTYPYNENNIKLKQGEEAETFLYINTYRYGELVESSGTKIRILIRQL